MLVFLISKTPFCVSKAGESAVAVGGSWMEGTLLSAPSCEAVRISKSKCEKSKTKKAFDIWDALILLT